MGLLAAVSPLFMGFDCSGDGSTNNGVTAPVSWSAPSGVSVTITPSPFALQVTGKDGAVLLESAPLDDGLASDDPMRAYAPLAITHDEDVSGPTVTYGWNYFRGEDDPWKHAAYITSVESKSDSLIAHLATSDSAHSATLTLSARGAGLRLSIAPDNNTDGSVNRVSLGFRLHDDDHFLGFGERFVRTDHRGQFLYSWVEDGGFGHGEGTPPGIANPSPSGEGETNMPVPWLLNPRGFGLFLEGTYRSNFHLGEERQDAWRVEATNGALDVTIFADPDPLNLVESLTAITGRPPEVADWALAPRRRANPGTDEAQKLRAAHIPTSVVDESVHYFPAGVPGDLKGAPIRALTADLHKRGFKAIAYFSQLVSVDWHPTFEDASAKGYFIKKPDGTPYVILQPPHVGALVDFTNPDAVTWYQSQLQTALDDGWDGWMYDFGEYVPQDAVFFNGKTGMEMHNIYPVLFQQAAYDLLEKQRKGDYLIFVRSGYSGTSGRVPMVWAGDQSTDFDVADGLPSALVGALNAGMSGIPLWGSDISGFHFVYNPPPDKEVYLRWTELGAFSADMHDENEGSGNNATTADRWQIWKDQESQDVYRKYASLKTRMLPYVRVAVRQARERGTPVMRHLYLQAPKDPRVVGITDEYMYGDSLLVAPVVARGATSRSVYLPEAQYYDYWTGARVSGGDVTATAPLDTVPVYARMGAIVPLLSADVETVVPSQDGSVVSMADRADFLEVAVFAGGDSSLTLDDGTTFEASAPLTPFSPSAPAHAGGAIPMAASAADLMTCDACAWDDAASHVYEIAVKTSEDAITAGPLTLRIKGSSSGSPGVKRYLFSVRH